MCPSDLDSDEFDQDPAGPSGQADPVDTKRNETLILKGLIVLLIIALISAIVAYFMLPFEIPLIIK